MKKKQCFVFSTYLPVAILLLGYLVFPSLYIAVSQKLFTVVYTYGMRLPEGADDTLPSLPVWGEGAVLPLYVIARPPQTPYDFFIATGFTANERKEYSSRYVYDSDLVPVGRVTEVYPTVVVVTLFSAPRSSEQFAVGEYITAGGG